MKRGVFFRNMHDLVYEFHGLGGSTSFMMIRDLKMFSAIGWWFWADDSILFSVGNPVKQLLGNPQSTTSPQTNTSQINKFESKWWISMNFPNKIHGFIGLKTLMYFISTSLGELVRYQSTVIFQGLRTFVMWMSSLPGHQEVLVVGPMVLVVWQGAVYTFNVT